MEFFDSHLHLDDQAFDADRDAVIARAREARVVEMVTAGTGVASSRAAVALAESHQGVYAAIAIHPQDAALATPEAMAELRAMADHPRVVAIGETGLDFVREHSPRDVQGNVFRAHLRLAAERQLPVVIHCREAYAEVLDILKEEGATGVIMHAFSGSMEIAQRCVGAGYTISLGGPVTYSNARRAVDITRWVPPQLLLLETDAPVLTPEPYRGRRNEPAYLPRIAGRIAEIRGATVEEIAATTTRNARRLYGLEP